MYIIKFIFSFVKQIVIMSNWPPSYEIRRSKRAKNIQLRVAYGVGLEVVVPLGFKHPPIEPFIEQNRAWIEKQLRHFGDSCNRDVLPESLALQGLQEDWQIEYQHRDGLTRIQTPVPQTLLVCGDIARVDACQALLKRWLVRYAKATMPAIFASIAQEIGLSYNKLSIRGQKTRWGSCSVQHDISLNYKLLFLPENLLRHVMIHELCHTREHNHSSRFWRLLAEFDENWRQNNADLTKAQKYIPTWII